ncbi:DUF4386 family protein [Dactylosporangium sp. NPDC049525]|uniref:DUF4386 family protein n=1 Tax=Dactylosporangium sp. NPDC049525 TaxID=3154730 RepID=UPI00344A4F3C
MRALNVRWCTGAAGVGYVVLAGLENMDFLAAPGRGDPGATAAYYTANPGGLRLAALVGALALVSYAAFAAGLFAALQHRRDPWALLLVTAGVAGPAVAAVSLLARVAAIAAPPADRLVRLHALHLDLRLAGGVLLGLTLIGAGVAAGVRERLLPRWLAACLLATGAWLVPVSAAALLSPGPLLDALAFAGFVADAVCVGVLATWLLLPRAGFAPTLAWLVFFVVSLAAGVSGAALLAFPGSTRTFFSWPLGPPPLAATIGACYVVAAAVYGLALRAGGPARRWAEARGLLGGVGALSVPIFVVTLHHLEAFDFAAWQAWAWVILFGLFPAAAAAAVWAGRRPYRRSSHNAVGWAPLVYGLLLAAAAMVLLAAPSVAAGLPVAAGPFGARVLAGWCALAAFLALRVATRPATETRPAAVALPLFPVAWLLAPLPYVPSGMGTVVWCTACATLLALALLPRPR